MKHEQPSRQPRGAKPDSDAPRRRAPGRRPPWLRRLLVLAGLVVVMGGLGLATGCGLMIARIPPVEALLAARPSGATTIYDREGRLVASLQNGENRELVPLAEIAEPMRQAVVASEDQRFYHHFGLDPMGVGRAVLTLGKAGGGSTITQQLAKNLFLSFDQTLTRKLADMYLAVQLERTLSKDKILEMYLNQVYFGHGAYGVEAASRKYFGKKARALTLAESAMLTGILPAPEHFSPYRRLEAAKERQALVLDRMVEAGYIDADAAASARTRPIRLAGTPGYAYRAPYFVSQVLEALGKRLDPDLVMRGGLKIHTTLDLGLQELAEDLVRNGVAGYKALNVGQGALVAVEPGTGAVRVLVGGTDYSVSQFNRATQAHRQPGSTFKPFVYLTAFADGYTPGNTITDEPISYGDYAPQNYDHRFHGAVSFEYALAKSLNVPAVKVAHSVGIGKVIKLANAAGIKSSLPENLSVALGSAEVTPLELASAYATFAANGVYAEPHLIARVEDKDGNLIEEWRPKPEAVVEEAAVWRLHRALSAVIAYGSGTAASFGRPAAGKTGTTSENRDTWFAGYTPDLACVVWLGNDNNSRLSSGATGGVLAAPLWRRFMTVAHRNLPVKPLFEAPAVAAPETGDDGVPAAPAGLEQAPVPGGAEESPAPQSQPLEGQPLQEPLPVEEPPAEPSVAPYTPQDHGGAAPQAAPSLVIP